MIRMTLCLSFALLCGCNAVTENAVRANQKFQSMIHTSAKRVQSWTEPSHTPYDAQPQPETRYCYKFSSDIVCYDQPQPNMSNPLFGYQGYAQPQMVQHETVMLAPQQPVSVSSVPSPAARSQPLPQAEAGEPLALMPRQ